MLRIRGGVLILALVIGLAVAAFLYARSGRQLQVSQRSMSLPVDLQTIIPRQWDVIEEQYRPCDYDSDDVQEWLIIYRYDPSSEPGYSLIGGVIYDVQTNAGSRAVSEAGPYPPASLVPYKLLPDIYAGKGQGYLGETHVAVTTLPASRGSPTCQASEIVIQGFSGSNWPTRLSIFQWASVAEGYRGVHFVGNARIWVPDASETITQVLTFNRLNDRSLLCEVQEYRRIDEQPATAGISPSFGPNPGARTIDFCFGAPQDPAYPEGVVIALLRGNNPNPDGSNPTPTENSFLTPRIRASLPTALNPLGQEHHTPYQVLSYSTPGMVQPQPNQIQELLWVPPAAPTPSGTPSAETWVWGRERAEVETDIIINGQMRRVTWTLISLMDGKVGGNVHWRIDGVMLP